jgi:CRISPR/Cas system-associated exonuclease Cas4 (RecB family)
MVKILRWLKMIGKEEIETAIGMNNPFPSNNVFKVTELTGCFMRPIIERKEKTKFIPNEAMIQGTLFHSFIPKIINANKEKYPNPQYEVEGSIDCEDEFGKFKIIGHCDVLLDDKILEFKYSKTIYPLNVGYLLQCNFYCELFKRPSCDLITVDKETFDVTCKEVKYDKESIDLIIYLAKQARKILFGKEIIDSSIYENSLCKYCQYKKQCKKYSKNTSLTIKDLK